MRKFRVTGYSMHDGHVYENSRDVVASDALHALGKHLRSRHSMNRVYPQKSSDFDPEKYRFPDIIPAELARW